MSLWVISRPARARSSSRSSPLSADLTAACALSDITTPSFTYANRCRPGGLRSQPRGTRSDLIFQWPFPRCGLSLMVDVEPIRAQCSEPPCFFRQGAFIGRDHDQPRRISGSGKGRHIRCDFVAAFSSRTADATSLVCSISTLLGRTRWRSQVFFGEFAKLIGNRTRNSERDRTVSDRIPSEAIADPIDGTLSRQTCHAHFGAGAARFIFKSKREFQLQIPMLLKMRHGDRQERDGLLVWVICEDRARQLLGDLGEDHGRGDWRVE